MIESTKKNYLKIDERDEHTVIMFNAHKWKEGWENLRILITYGKAEVIYYIKKYDDLCDLNEIQLTTDWNGNVLSCEYS